MENVMNAVTQLNNTPYFEGQYHHLNIQYDGEHKAVWSRMCAHPRPCFTMTQLDEFLRMSEDLRAMIDAPGRPDVDYIVVSSDVPGVFNLGGDLNLFSKLIQEKNRAGLFDYARACIDVLYENITNIQRDVTTIALVQGDALGGGFESAMASDILIAERSARMGLPEILFNLFPGMGAYSLLSRKVGGSKAERMILSGRIYTAEELHDMGVVDILVEDHEGEIAVHQYIKKENALRNGYRGLRAAKAFCNAVSYDELIGIGKIWVDTALCLTHRDLRMIDRLVKRQSAKTK